MTQPLKTLAPPTQTSPSALFQARVITDFLRQFATDGQLSFKCVQKDCKVQLQIVPKVQGAAGSREGDVGALPQAVLTTDPATSTR